VYEYDEGSIFKTLHDNQKATIPKVFRSASNLTEAWPTNMIEDKLDHALTPEQHIRWKLAAHLEDGIDGYLSGKDGSSTSARHSMDSCL
jgi:hypothetical protein